MPLECPTCPDAEEGKCCSCGGEIPEADQRLLANPYQNEINGDEAEHLECNNCYRNACDDI